MYQVGQLVVYGIHGVCRIVDKESRVIDRKKVTYLVLEPLGQSGSRFLVPTHNSLAMGKVKQLLSREELTRLLGSPEIRRDVWLPDEGPRKQRYRELISSGDREQLMEMVHTLYLHRSRQALLGKKCHMCDENFIRDAEKLLVGELVVVLELEPEEAREYLRRALA